MSVGARGGHRSREELALGSAKNTLKKINIRHETVEKDRLDHSWVELRCEIISI